MPNTTACSVAGSLSAGMICAETLSDKTSDLSFDEAIAFLEPTEERAGAICQSAADWNLQKTALEKACRLLGKRCSYETRQAIKALGQVPARIQ